MKYDDNDFCGKTVLIDADSLCYSASGDSFETAKSKLEWKIERIKKTINWSGEKFIYFLTLGKSFRNELQEDYKANRKGVRPETVKQLKKYIIDNYNDLDSEVIYKTGFEADDLICDKYREDSDNYLICSIDKDILYNMVGTHINLYDATIVKTDYYEANNHFYKQLILGDPVDNIPNLVKGIGKSRLQDMNKYTGLSYEEIGKYICNKKGVDYRTRYRMLYCGFSEDLILNEEVVDDNKILDSFIEYGKYVIDKTEKTKLKNKVKKEKILNKYKPDSMAPGKHKDKTWLEVKEQDPSYVNWMINVTKDNNLKEMLKSL